MKHLLDTGPIVAYLRDDDEWHQWSIATLSNLTGQFFTCDAVVTEAAHLLRQLPCGYDALLGMIETGHLLVLPVLPAEASALRTLRRKFGQRMDYADACLVRLSELHDDCRVVTIDHDFEIYRRHRRERIPLLAPFAS